jgi:phosphoglycerate kinase
MRTIDEVDVKNKKVLVRVDINSPVENGVVVMNPRIKAHAETIKKLSERGAYVIVIAHQGRKGNEDFTCLDQHAKLLEKTIGKQVKYVEDVCGPHAKEAIKNLKQGEILLLDNVRMLEDETKKPYDAEIVKQLSPLIDYFVLDTLSVAHREHASVVGFMKKVPSYGGPVLKAEVEAIKKIKSSDSVSFFFGGAKVDDSFTVLREWLGNKRTKKIMLSGLIGVLFLYASGKKIGKSYETLMHKDLLRYEKDAKELLAQFGDKIVLPLDVALNINGKRVECDVDKITEETEGEIFDIGEKTIKLYNEIIYDSEMVVVNGPAGVYEQEEFSKGTKETLKAMAESRAFCLVGGGHSIIAIEKFNINKEKFGYVSLSGKALIEYLCGDELPGIKGLEENAKLFKK